MSINSLHTLISANHIFHLLFFTALSILLFREAKKRNGFTKAVALVFAALALNSLWSVLLLLNVWHGDIPSYAHRAGAGTLLSISLLWLLVKFWKDSR